VQYQEISVNPVIITIKTGLPPGKLQATVFR
jgi:hypothetical protein